MKKNALRFFGFALFLTVAMWCPVPAQATTYDLYPTSDQVYLHDHWPGGAWNRWDANPNPNIAHYYYDYSPGFGSSAGLYTTYLQFDLGSVGAGASITSANLYLDLLSLSGDSNATVTINGVDNLLSRPLGWNAFDVKSLLGTGTTASFSTGLSDPDHAGVDVQFGSPASGQAPYLEITTNEVDPLDPPGASVPEPTTILFLGFGLVGLVGVRRFKK